MNTYTLFAGGKTWNPLFKHEFQASADEQAIAYAESVINTHASETFNYFELHNMNFTDMMSSKCVAKWTAKKQISIARSDQ